MSVHRADCPNVSVTSDAASRVIAVNWDVGLDREYTVEIEIHCNDNPGILSSILAVPTEMKINVSSVNARANRNNKTSVIILGIEVHATSQVNQIMAKIRRLKDIYSVSRAMTSNADKRND